MSKPDKNTLANSAKETPKTIKADSPKVNERLQKTLPEETQAVVTVIGLEDHETMTHGVIQGVEVDFKTLTKVRATRIAKDLKKREVENPFLILK